jgi:RimJ/RimL family protein N-acetyltransferase
MSIKWLERTSPRVTPPATKEAHPPRRSATPFARAGRSMDGSVTRDQLVERLPFRRDGMIVRRWERSDLDLLARWPAYPEEYSVFRLSFASLGPAQMDSLYRERESQDNRFTLVVDRGSARSIAYIAVLEIDWASGWSGNMGIRVHPEWCDKGVGSRSLNAVADWWFAVGMNGLRLDVASSNARAVRCYEKVGFVRRGEFWRGEPDLRGTDLTAPKWHFLEGHVRVRSELPEVRFLSMELKPGEQVARAGDARVTSLAERRASGALQCPQLSDTVRRRQGL